MEFLLCRQDAQIAGMEPIALGDVADVRVTNVTSSVGCAPQMTPSACLDTWETRVMRVSVSLKRIHVN